MMKQLWKQVDGLLRGREAFSSEEALGQVRAAHLVLMVLLLGAVYGVFMGVYAIFSRATPEYRQLVSSGCKVPALFLLTLFICYPSLYVFSTLLGSRLSFWSTLRLLAAGTTIAVTVLASFGPIVGFFALSTESYPFMKLLNVAFFAVAGFLGVTALRKGWNSLVSTHETPAVPPPVPPPGVPPVLPGRVPEDPRRQINQVFRLWIVIYALVGCQMAWVLRPFVLNPGGPFAWFRARHANFFVDVWQTIWKILN
jgi:hypothetical protein